VAEPDAARSAVLCAFARRFGFQSVPVDRRVSWTTRAEPPVLVVAELRWRTRKRGRSRTPASPCTECAAAGVHAVPPATLPEWRSRRVEVLLKPSDAAE